MSSPESPANESEPHEENWHFSLTQNARRIRERRETLRFLISANLKAGHRDKLLGNLWNLLDPLLFLGVYFLVFGIGLRQAQGDPYGFVVYLSIGVLAFRFFEGSVSQAAVCVRSNAGLLHSVYFPKAMLPIAVCFSRLYDFAWGLAVLIGAMWLALDFSFSVQIFWLPLILLLQFLLCMGFAFIVAYLGAIFADTQNIVAIGTRLLFFLSPIFYFARPQGDHEGIIPERYLFYYELNPLARLLDGYRDALLWGATPTNETLLYLGGTAALSLILGFWLFSRAEGHFAKYL
ncbi:MAG: ABC transporter permease [Myxococcota bacterium]|nr:ABC transporter permease [Myxococcota bacterium]